MLGRSLRPCLKIVHLAIWYLDEGTHRAVVDIMMATLRWVTEPISKAIRGLYQKDGSHSTVVWWKETVLISYAWEWMMLFKLSSIFTPRKLDLTEPHIPMFDTNYVHPGFTYIGRWKPMVQRMWYSAIEALGNYIIPRDPTIYGEKASKMCICMVSCK